MNFSKLVTSDQSQNHVILEPSASLACHIIHYLFTSGPRALVYKKSTYDQRLITSTFRSICFNTFLLVLKCLFLMSKLKLIFFFILKKTKNKQQTLKKVIKKIFLAIIISQLIKTARLVVEMKEIKPLQIHHRIIPTAMTMISCKLTIYYF